jgi:WD40 repeat protein
MFACNDGVVAVVDYFTNMEKVAGELYREDTSGDPSKEPVKIKISCISMSPSTSYLAVGGSDGKVAIYDTTSDWCEIQLLDFSSHNDVADSRAPKQVKITALSWSPNSSYLIIGDNRGNIFLVTTMGRVSLPGSMASSGRSSAIVEMQLPSDEPTPKLAWRVVKAVFNKKYSYRAHRSQRCRSVNKTSTKGKSKKDRSRARTYSAGTEENSESGQSHHPPSDDDDSDNDDGYNELRHDPIETVTCMKWNMDMSYIVVGRINHVITLYLFDKETLG